MEEYWDVSRGKIFCSVSAANVNELVKLEKSQLPKAKSIQPHRMPGSSMDHAIKRILFSWFLLLVLRFVVALSWLWRATLKKPSNFKRIFSIWGQLGKAQAKCCKASGDATQLIREAVYEEECFLKIQPRFDGNVPAHCNSHYFSLNVFEHKRKPKTTKEMDRVK